MKKLIVFLALIVSISACKKEQKESAVKNDGTENVKSIDPVSDEMMETAIIYEANIRQYSPEGTFAEFTKDIPEIKKLGVKVIWLMPIFPISETNRKAKGNLMVEDITDPEERKKYLGSYYAVSDFKKINPEFGTIEDFRQLVKTAHDNEIYVILDWVPNHTGWDHAWLKSNPEFYTQNKNGDVIHPEGTDWTDVADLNYDNKEMHKKMIEDMKYWVSQEDVDGFRCDVAGSVPMTFWNKAVPQLRAEKELFMLAEAWEPELLKDGIFDMAYAWEGHHILNELAKEKQGVKEWITYMDKIKRDYEQNDILMNFITNHDENSWNGTIKERMGDAGETMLAMSYVIPGMPLIYSGQEYDLDHRLKFFEKDSIPKTKGKMWPLLEKLGKLKTTSSALNGGKQAATYKGIDSENNKVLMFERTKNGVSLTFVANLSNNPQNAKHNLEGSYLNYISNSNEEFNKETEITLQPWEYKILMH